VDGHDDESLGSEAAREPEQAGFRWRRWHTVLSVIVMVVLAAVVASLISIPYYAITPGSAQSVERLIGVPKQYNHAHDGQVLLVDVELTPLRAIEWPFFELDPNADIVSSASLLGTVNAAQYQIQGELDMSDAQQAATVVALRRLGHHVSVRSNGALVYSLLPGSPAAQSLSVGDRVVGVDGRRVATFLQLGRLLSRYQPGDEVSLAVVGFASHQQSKVRLRLSAWRVKGRGKSATLVCPLYGTDLRLPLYHPTTGSGSHGSGSHGSAPDGCIGVDLEASYVVGKLPFRVDLSSEGIIGPSAGLAFTLGLIERLDPFDLTGGHKIAATGTMDIYGDVGDVGGVAQKTVAVRDSGAKVFFVPRQEYKVALAHAGSTLKVYEVSSIDQAIHILVTKYGGKLPVAGKSA
jgi:PDZ domain-containing protein